MQASTRSQLAIARNVPRVLSGIIGFLILSNALLIPFASDLESIDGHFGHAIRQIDLNVEKNLATWCSSMLLLLNAICAYMLAHCRWLTHRRVALLMMIMSSGFLALSIDDFIGLHDYVESVTADQFGGDDGHTLVRNLGPLFAISLAIVFISLFTIPLIRTAQRKNIPLLFACILCVFLVALAEFVYLLSECAEAWCYRLEVVFEEGCEFSACLLFLMFQSRELLSLYENKKIEITA